MSTPIEPLIDQAISAGILPGRIEMQAAPPRPWPIVVLLVCGAWLVTLLFAPLIGLVFGGWRAEAAMALGLGAGLLVAATLMLRATRCKLFLELLAFHGMLLGGGLLGYGLLRMVPDPVSTVAMTLVSLAVGYAVRQDWLRVLMGGCAAGFAVLAIPMLLNDVLGFTHHGIEDTMVLVGFQVATGIWAGLECLCHRLAARARSETAGIFLDRSLLGWALALLFGLSLGLSLGAATTFLSSESNPFPIIDGSQGAGVAIGMLLANLLSAAAGLLAVGMLVRTWPSLRAPWFLLPALALAALCFVIPALGPCLLILCMAAVAGHWNLAGAAGLAGLWVVASFCHALVYPLPIKAGGVLAIACVLALSAWLRLRVAIGSRLALVRPASLGTAGRWLALGCMGLLVVINTAIWQNQDLINNGRPVYVELAPVDPDSLKEAEFMPLRFRLPPDQDVLRSSPERWFAVGTLDAKGVLRLTHYRNDMPLKEREILIGLVPKRGYLVLVTDRWDFEKGSEAKWAKARYGEFRIDDGAKPILVGLRGPNLEPL